MTKFCEDIEKRKEALSEIEKKITFYTEHYITIQIPDEDYGLVSLEWTYDEEKKRFIPSSENLMRIIATGVFEKYLTRTCDHDERLATILDDLCGLLEKKFWYPNKGDKMQSYRFVENPLAE